MITPAHLLAVLGLYAAIAYAQHRPDASQQAGLFSFSDTTGTDFDARQAHDFVRSKPQTIVLDVRTPEEYARGHINNATNLNLYDAKFVTKLTQLDRAKTYVVHCAAGLPNGRSRKAVALLDSLGFKHIHHVNGGFNAWKQAGLPVITNQ